MLLNRHVERKSCWMPTVWNFQKAVNLNFELNRALDGASETAWHHCLLTAPLKRIYSTASISYDLNSAGVTSHVYMGDILTT